MRLLLLLWVTVATSGSGSTDSIADHEAGRELQSGMRQGHRTSSFGASSSNLRVSHDTSHEHYDDRRYHTYHHTSAPTYHGKGSKKGDYDYDDDHYYYDDDHYYDESSKGKGSKHGGKGSKKGDRKSVV